MSNDTKSGVRGLEYLKIEQNDNNLQKPKERNIENCGNVNFACQLN